MLASLYKLWHHKFFRELLVYKTRGTAKCCTRQLPKLIFLRELNLQYLLFLFILLLLLYMKSKVTALFLMRSIIGGAL